MVRQHLGSAGKAVMQSMYEKHFAHAASAERTIDNVVGAAVDYRSHAYGRCGGEMAETVALGR